MRSSEVVHGQAPGRSLGPGGGQARSPRACVENLLACGSSPMVPSSSLVESLTAVAAAFAEDFPDNLYCDLDALGGHLAGLAEPQVRETVACVVRLSHLYGRQGPLRFRYVHDFLYGFDWCRWVAKDPLARVDVGPYALPFLGYLEARAAELRLLVEAGDTKYGPLADGLYRNPFGFDREPSAEAWLLRKLGEQDLMPLACWTPDARPRFVPVVEAREALAAEAARLQGRA